MNSSVIDKRTEEVRRNMEQRQLTAPAGSLALLH